ncbi:MAG TPA: DUF4111 domain-containing protein [bacterium]|nr:DUF4111 domain-containing protein [bacterium]
MDRRETGITNQTGHIRDVCRAFRNGLQSILDDVLHGAYVFGAAAFPDTLPTHDIDFHVLLTRRLIGDEKPLLEAMHRDLGDRYPPLGADMDGYYILVEDAQHREPPRSELWANAVDDSWALHCAHIRAGRCIVLTGPDPSGIYPEPTWNELEATLYHELEYVQNHLKEYPDYCILNLCRLIYSFETRDVVVSKAGAAEWAMRTLPEDWHRCIDLACRSYAGDASLRDQALMRVDLAEFFRYALLRINSD